MGTITAATIINRAATQLLDSGNTRWTRAELLQWLNDGQRQIVQIKPTNNNKVASLTLVAGTRQSIPADGWMLLGVTRNMGMNGITPGPAVRLASREIMDSLNPNWHTDPADAVVQNFIYDLSDQTAFYIYPPSPGGNTVEINYSQVPADLPNENTAIALSDILQTTLLDYIMFRANSKDAEYAPGLELAKAYWATFSGAISAKDSAEKEVNPNQRFGPFDEADRGGAGI